jgi:hypothetical protein
MNTYLDVFALKVAGHKWVAVGLAVAGEEPDGVGVGLDGPRALVLGLQGAPEAAVEDQEVTAGQLAVGARRWRGRHRSLIRVWWSGWLAAACSG